MNYFFSLLFLLLLTFQEFLDVDPVIHYDHEELSAARKAGDPAVWSVWDIEDLFHVKILSVEGIPQVRHPYTTSFGPQYCFSTAHCLSPLHTTRRC